MFLEEMFHYALRTTLQVHIDILLGSCSHGKPGKVMEFEWLIFRPGEVMEIFENVKNHGKVMENGNIPYKKRKFDPT